jgi:ABC-type sugar transport system permease subunit
MAAAETLPATEPAKARRVKKRTSNSGSATASESRLAIWLIMPSGLLLGLVVGYPIISALWLSFHGDPLTGPRPWVGFKNYTRALWGTDHQAFWASFRVTLLFTVSTVILEVIIGVLMALVMNRKFPGRALVRACVLVPWAIPTAVTAKMWEWILQPNGILNKILPTSLVKAVCPGGWLDERGHIIWLHKDWPAKFAIIMADTWKTAPFVALLVLAGLQIIPDDLYEAARVDGATAWQRFVRITLPLLKPALLVAVLFRMLDVMRIYDLPAILTQGANDTNSLSLFAYHNAIQGTHFGYGSALSTLTFLIIFIMAFGMVKLLGVKVMETQAKGVR